MGFRRRRLPAAERPPLRRGERLLAWARSAGGETVVATNHGLHFPGEARAAGGTLASGRAFAGWHEIHKATWTGDELVITLGEVVGERDGYQVVADRPPVTLPVPEPGDLPPVVRDRVTRSVSFSSHHPVPGGGVRVVARRVPGVDGLSWAVRYDEGTDRGGPGVPEATGELVAAHAAAQESLP